jgi:uncharacterized protein
MTLSENEKQFLVGRIRSFFPKSEYSIRLFGSFATNRARPGSDVDIAIIGRGPIPAGKWQMLEDDLSESEFPKAVDLIDYHRVSPEFKKIIDRDGINLD